MSAAARSSFTDRVLRSARLDPAVYEEIEADAAATTEAGIVVVLGGIAAGIADGVRLGFIPFVVVALLALASWSFYAWLAYFFGGTLLKGPLTQTSWSEIARTLGFANSPRLLLFLAAVPGLGVVAIIVPLWIIATSVVALRAALDCGTGRALIIAIIASVAQYVLTAVLLALQANA